MFFGGFGLFSVEYEGVGLDLLVSEYVVVICYMLGIIVGIWVFFVSKDFSFFRVMF